MFPLLPLTPQRHSVDAQETHFVGQGWYSMTFVCGDAIKKEKASNSLERHFFNGLAAGLDGIATYAAEAAKGGLAATKPPPTSLAGSFLVFGHESRLSADLGFKGTGLLPALRFGSGPRGGAAWHGPSANCVGLCFLNFYTLNASV